MAGDVAGGHRHDWESVVVWLDSFEAQNMIGAAASGHGSFGPSLTPNKDGDRVKVEYYTTFPTNHELQFTDTLGKSFNKVEWDTLPVAARDALQAADFGSANVPMKDGNFLPNLDKAVV